MLMLRPLSESGAGVVAADTQFEVPFVLTFASQESARKAVLRLDP